MTVTGYAMKDRHGVIDVRTVSPTKRAAKVNGLHLHANRPILNSFSDEIIDMLWDRYAEDMHCAVVAVTITEGVGKDAPQGAGWIAPASSTIPNISG